MRIETSIPAVTIVIEWENAIDVEDKWTLRAMSALETELARVAERVTEKPRIMFLYDDTKVDPANIRSVLDEAAPRLGQYAAVDLVATPGLTYYQLKNFGIAQSTTGISVMLDSDAAPQPGWLESLLEPFGDPEVAVVAGFTVLGHEDLLSRTMALSWIFELPEEREETAKRVKVNANNCAVRTDFFNQHPFPELPTFKKQCRYWLQDVLKSGRRFVRTADAMTVHAPHPGLRFLAWRAWTSGMDGDFVANGEGSGRTRRLAYATKRLKKNVKKSWSRIINKGHAVGLTPAQRPAALTIATTFYLITYLGAIASALTRTFAPVQSYAKRPAGQSKLA